jgi:hypothetical protein
VLGAPSRQRSTDEQRDDRSMFNSNNNRLDEDESDECKYDAGTSTATVTNVRVNTHLKKEQIARTYREQEEELTLLRYRVTETVKSSANTQEDTEEERLSPLGDILSVVFQPHQRKLQQRLRRTELGNFRERVAAVATAVTSIGKFDGSVQDAPMYLLQLCSQVQQYGFDEREIVSIMQRTLTGNALMWLNSNMHDVFTLDYKPVQALLHRFRKQYIGAHITRDLRKQMATTVIMNNALTSRHLDTHYAAYQELLMRLRMSDRHVDEEETRVEFFTSLPRSVRSFIGSNIDRCQTVHDVYVLAQKSVLLNATSHKQVSDDECEDMQFIVSENEDDDSPAVTTDDLDTTVPVTSDDETVPVTVKDD